MRLNALIRTSPALYVLPIAVAMTFVYYGDLHMWPDSWFSVFTSAATTLFLPVTLGAAIAAWDVGRLRAAAVPNWGPSRSAWAVTAPMTLPALTVSLGTLLLMWAIAGSRMSVHPFTVPWQPLLLLPLTVLAWTALGAVAGWHLNRFFAAPLMLVLAFFLEAYPPAISDPQWRNLSGEAWFSCCVVSKQPHPDLLAASLPIPAAALIAALIWWNRQITWRKVAASALVIVAGAAIAVPPARAIGWEPVQHRDAAELRCVDGRIEICLWPESQAFHPAIEAIAVTIEQRLDGYGVDLRDRLVETYRADLDEWTFRTSPTFTAGDHFHSVLDGLIVGYGACGFLGPHAERGDIHEWELVNLMMHWLNIVVRDSSVEEELASYGEDEPLREWMVDILALPREQQGEWFNLAQESLRQCDYDLARWTLSLDWTRS